MKEKRASISVENHSRKSIKAQALVLPPNFNVANVARLSFGKPENSNEAGAETNSFGYALQRVKAKLKPCFAPDGQREKSACAARTSRWSQIL